jgi:hypothetical protein
MDYRPSQPHEPKGEAMRGNLLLVLLLVLLPATSVAQADKKPAAEHAAGAAKTQVKTEAVTGQKEEAQAKTKAPQEGTPEAQAETKKAQGQAEAAQVKTEAGQTEEAQAQTDKDPKLTSVPGGNALGMSKEVFMRELRYYEIRSEKKP